MDDLLKTDHIYQQIINHNHHLHKHHRYILELIYLLLLFTTIPVPVVGQNPQISPASPYKSPQLLILIQISFSLNSLHFALLFVHAFLGQTSGAGPSFPP